MVQYKLYSIGTSPLLPSTLRTVQYIMDTGQHFYFVYVYSTLEPSVKHTVWFCGREDRRRCASSRCVWSKPPRTKCSRRQRTADSGPRWSLRPSRHPRSRPLSRAMQVQYTIQRQYNTSLARGDDTSFETQAVIAACRPMLILVCTRTRRKEIKALLKTEAPCYVKYSYGPYVMYEYCIP